MFQKKFRGQNVNSGKISQQGNVQRQHTKKLGTHDQRLKSTDLEIER